jgi:amidase
LAPSFDTVGLLARSGAILTAAWDALHSGAASPGDQPLPRTIRRIVVAADLFALADPEAASALRASLHSVAGTLGLAVEEVDLAPSHDLDVWRDSFRAIQMVEAWRSDGEWITARSPDLGGGITSRFAAAKDADPSRAEEGRLVRPIVGQRLFDVLGDDGVLAQPAASGPAPAFELDPAVKDDLRNRTLTLTAPAGMAGAPVVSLPTAALDGLPLGLALVGLPGSDESLVAMAAALEEAS